MRIASDITGGTPLENIKCRVTATTEGPMEAARNIMSTSGIQGLWSGTPSRTIEGALLGAFFLVGSAATKKRVLVMTGSKTMGSLAGGVVGGVAIVIAIAGWIVARVGVVAKTIVPPIEVPTIAK